VVVDGEAGRLRFRCAGEPLRRRLVQVAAGARAVVTGDSLFAPPEVVDRGDVREEVEPLSVAQVEARLDDPRRIDDERRLAIGVLALDKPGYAFERQLATPRISYAGGTPPLIFS
jgi:hypothetical protein